MCIVPMHAFCLAYHKFIHARMQTSNYMSRYMQAPSHENMDGGQLGNMQDVTLTCSMPTFAGMHTQARSCRTVIPPTKRHSLRPSTIMSGHTLTHTEKAYRHTNNMCSSLPRHALNSCLHPNTHLFHTLHLKQSCVITRVQTVSE